MTTKSRETKETKINLELELRGEGKAEIKTGVGFFDHMLDTLTKHSLINLKVECDGDLHIDAHHTVEDVGIVLGQAFYDEIFPIQNVERFANRIAILDEAAVEVIMDLSGRSHIYYEVPIEGMVGQLDCELVEEFFRQLVANMKIGVHIRLIRGTNKHHIIEALFKAFAITLRSATTTNDRLKVPSTKGVL